MNINSTLIRCRYLLTTLFTLSIVALQAQIVVVDHWTNQHNGCEICGETDWSSTTQTNYNGDLASFADPINDPFCNINSVSITFNVAACDEQEDTDGDVNNGATIDPITLAYPIEINGVVVGTFDPTELPCSCNYCESGATATVTYPWTPALAAAYNIGGTNTVDLNFESYSLQELGFEQHICVADVVLDFDVECGFFEFDCEDDQEVIFAAETLIGTGNAHDINLPVCADGTITQIYVEVLAKSGSLPAAINIEHNGVTKVAN